MNYFQKYFLIFLYLNMSLVYGMKRDHEDAAQIQDNKAFMKAIKEAAKNEFSCDADWQKIRNCLEAKDKVDPNRAINKFGTTILILASLYGKKDFVDYLLQRGDVNVNIPNSRGWTPLFLMLETLEHNNEEGSENEEESENEQGPEEEPVVHIIKSLLAHKADIKSEVWGEIPLPFVAQWGYKDLVKPLIECGADINEADVWDHKPLKWAIGNKDLEMIAELCQAGACLFNLDDFGYNAFHLTANLDPKYSRALITHTRFDSEIINKERNEEIKKTLWVLANWREDIKLSEKEILKNQKLPQEVLLHIFSKLPPSFFCDKGLCMKLSEMGYKHPSVLFQLNNRVEWIKQALQGTNKRGKNPLQYLLDKNNKKKYKQKPKVEALLSVNELQNAYDIFDKNFPAILETNPENLICQMYMNQLDR